MFNSETRFGSLLIPQGTETVNVHRWRAWATPFMSRKCMEWLRTIRCPKSSNSAPWPILDQELLQNLPRQFTFSISLFGESKNNFFLEISELRQYFNILSKNSARYIFSLIKIMIAFRKYHVLQKLHLILSKNLQVRQKRYYLYNPNQPKWSDEKNKSFFRLRLVCILTFLLPDFWYPI